jgi:hypothetical protein
MIKYLQRNKEWIFSGCGVVLLLLIGQFIWQHLPSHEKATRGRRLPTSQVSPTTLARPGTPPTTNSSRVPTSPITFAEVNRVASDRNLTGLQKDEFRRKHQGKIVEWTVRVLSVARLWEHESDSDFNVVFADAAETKGSHFGETGVASFPANLRDDMVDLNSGDIVRLRGVLKFLGGSSHPLVTVDGCELLEHRKK